MGVVFKGYQEKWHGRKHCKERHGGIKVSGVCRKLKDTKVTGLQGDPEEGMTGKAAESGYSEGLELSAQRPAVEGSLEFSQAENDVFESVFQKDPFW